MKTLIFGRLRSIRYSVKIIARTVGNGAKDVKDDRQTDREVRAQVANQLTKAASLPDGEVVVTMKTTRGKTINNMKMMKTKNLILFLFIAMTASAQKQFTLEDLNFGGNNYHNMVPKTIPYLSTRKRAKNRCFLRSRL